MNITIKIFTVILLFSAAGVSQAQKNSKKAYKQGEIIVHLKEYMADHQQVDFVRGTAARFKTQKAIKNDRLRFVFDSLGITEMRKVMRNSSSLERVSISRNGENVPIPDFHNLFYGYVPDSTDISLLCVTLNKTQGIAYAEPNFIMYIDALSPNDSEYYLQRGLEQANDIDIDAKRAWDFTTGSNTVKVAIIDTGIDYNHPDLGDAFGNTAIKVKGGYDYYDSDSNPDDYNDDSHGTAVAGIIGALSNNTTGIAGVAGGDQSIGNNGVQLFALKVGGSGRELRTGDILDALYDAATSSGAGGYGCHLINLSAGALASQYQGHQINSYRKALSYVANNAAIFVAAKGNDDTSQTNYPSDYADNLVISVGASDGSDRRASFSNFGNGIDAVAPGTTDLLRTTKRVEQNSYGSFSGTSGAAPVVTGIGALLKSVNINLHRDDIENIIEISAQDVRQDLYTYTNGYNNEMGHGRVNAGRALELLHAPYVLQQHTATGGTSQNITHGDREGFSFLNDAGDAGLAEGAYWGKIYQVTRTVTVPKSACNEQYIWSRTTGATFGWSAANPNNNLDYSFIVSQNGDQVTLRTFVYYIEYNAIGQQINAWFPTAPQNVVFAYTTLTKEPYTTDIAGSSLICTNGNTLSLTTFPPNSAITWQATPSTLFAVSSGNGSNATLTAASSSVSGSGTITFTINTSCGSQAQISKPVWVGTPTITFVDKFCVGIEALYRFKAPIISGATYTWSINNPNLSVDFFNHNCEVSGVPGGPSQSYVLTLQITQGNCTVSKTRSGIYSDCTGGGKGGPLLQVFPNPASNELLVEYGDATYSNEPILIELISPSLDKVYSSKTNEGSIVIPVRNLPKGTYYLHVTNQEGVIKRNIFIEH